MPGPCREMTLAEVVDRLPGKHGARNEYEQLRGVASDLASRECETPGECGDTLPFCLPCRARGALVPLAQFWSLEDLERRREELGGRGFGAEYQMNPGPGAIVNCRSCRGPAGIYSAKGWVRRDGDMGWTKVMAEHFSAKCKQCCERDGETFPALRYEGTAPGSVEFDGCPVEPLEEKP